MSGARVRREGCPPPKWATEDDFFRRGDRVALDADVPRTPVALQVEALMNHQEGICAICGHPILLQASVGRRKGATLDHVFPRNGVERWRRRGLVGRTVVAHGDCNSAKGNRAPTGCELIWLAAVNARQHVSAVLVNGGVSVYPDRRRAPRGARSPMMER